MRQQPIQHKAAVWLWLFMAAYLLNISVDAPDITNLKEDLRFNDQESIVELVVEKCFGFDNLIAEHDDTDSNEQSQAKKGFTLDYFVLPEITSNSKWGFFTLKQPHSFGTVEIQKQLFSNATNPPPEV